jgi:hypothetical protein
MYLLFNDAAEASQFRMRWSKVVNGEQDSVWRSAILAFFQPFITSAAS